MLLSHFDTCCNGVKTIWKPNPKSLGIPELLHTEKYVKKAFHRAPFELNSKPMLKNKCTQHLRLKLRSTPTPDVIFVPYMPNNLALYCSGQLRPYKKLQPILQTGAESPGGLGYEDF